MKFLGFEVNHHHIGETCKCNTQADEYTQEMIVHKVRLSKKCELIQQQLQDALKLYEL